ncbi:VWA domain-containing protein [Nocardia neocaledoniensis]|uniref:VWA domain-containing protein n=1 Tax=Nocardia neocaledoniensis TaxID=236511 RepID=UPI002456163F|nr:VWA domain-containing protein [Nocardia neocaledoniensis]
MPRRRRTRSAVAVFLAALALVGTGCARTISGSARPATANTTVCDAGVMVVLDVSLSMQATDVSPSRLHVAQQAVREYALALRPDTGLGLTTFAGTAQLQAMPSTDRGPFLAAVESIELAERTATGEAIFTHRGRGGTSQGHRRLDDLARYRRRRGGRPGRQRCSTPGPGSRRSGVATRDRAAWRRRILVRDNTARSLRGAGRDDLHALT